MCAQCIRHPINGSVFTLLLSAFFRLLSGWRWNNVRRAASFSKISSLWAIILLLSSVRKSTLHIFLMSIGAKWLCPLKYLSHYISSTFPFRSVGVWCVFLRFKATTCVCSPALIAGQGFICLFEQTLNCAFSDVTHSAKTCSVLRSVVVASFFILLFGLLSSDCIWKWCHRSVPIVCAVLVNRRLVSLTASVWDWCFRR